MFQKRTPKSEQPYKSVYVCHNPHTIDLGERKWPERIRIISVDPGITHYAIRVEERSTKSVGFIKTLLFDKIGLKKDDQVLSKDLVSPLYTFLMPFLDQHKELFKTCHMVVIEKQLPINYRAVRMSQHTLSYFMILMKNQVPELPMFFEIAPTLKGRELGVPPNLNERGLKLWAIEKARELMVDRSDKIGLAILDRKVNGRKEKKDDLSDVVCQIEALFSYFNWPLTKPVVKLSLGITQPSSVVTLQLQPSPQTNTTTLQINSRQNQPQAKQSPLIIQTQNPSTVQLLDLHLVQNQMQNPLTNTPTILKPNVLKKPTLMIVQ